MGAVSPEHQYVLWGKDPNRNRNCVPNFDRFSGDQHVPQLSPVRFGDAVFSVFGLPMRDEHTEYSCAAALAIEVLQGKWRIQILCVMREGPVRLGQLGRRIPSASKKVLTENLRNLESAGVVVRTDMSRQVRHVEYDLAEASKFAMHELLDHLAKRGELYDLPRRQPPKSSLQP
jgi:DNA-binding HxlR family transcriptional regulator